MGPKGLIKRQPVNCQCVWTVALQVVALTSVALGILALTDRPAWAALTVACPGAVDRALTCSYVVSPPGRVLEATASVAGLQIADPKLAPNASTLPTAVHFLLDTSDAGRSTTAITTVQHLAQFIDKLQPNMSTGLILGGQSTKPSAPLGSSATAVKKAADKAQPILGQRQLAPTAMAAIDQLAAHKAQRRILMIMSDGLTSDTEASLQTLVAQAQEKRVTLFIVGYPRSVSLSSGLERLRRLANRAAGHFVLATSGGALPKEFLDQPFEFLQDGGQMRMQLPASNLPPKADLEVWFETGNGPDHTRVSLDLAGLPPPPANPVAQGAKSQAEAVQQTTSHARPESMFSDSKGLIIAFVGLIVAGSGIAGAIRRRNRVAKKTQDAPEITGEKNVADATSGAMRAVGILEVEGATPSHQVIGTEKVTLGRTSASDVMVDEPSVSRHHAEITRTEHGDFKIVDLESMNGLFVNGKRRRRATLADGDKVELGDAVLHFSIEQHADHEPGNDPFTPPELRKPADASIPKSGAIQSAHGIGQDAQPRSEPTRLSAQRRD